MAGQDSWQGRGRVRGTSTARRAGAAAAVLVGLIASGAAGAGEPQYRFRVFGPDQGLPAPLVTDVVQDRAGFLWLAGLSGGLIRYDGHDALVFEHDPDNPNSLSHTEVRDLALAEDGQLWLSTARGLTSLDPQTLRFRRWAEDMADPGHLLVDHDGRVWFGTFDQGLFRLDPESGEITQMPVGLSVAPGLTFGVNKIYQEPAGRIWVGLASGLVAFDPGSDRPAATFTHDPQDPRSLPGGAAISTLRDDAGVLWVGTNDGIGLLEPGEEGFRRLPAPREGEVAAGQIGAAGITMLYQDGRGQIWAGTTTAGLYRLADREAFYFEAFAPVADDPYSIGGAYVWNVIEDADGVLHFAAGGLSSLDPDTGLVTGWSAGQPEGIAKPGGVHSATGLKRVDGTIAVGGLYGIHALDPEMGSWNTFALDPDNRVHPQNRVTALGAAHEGGLWVGLNKRLGRWSSTEGYTQLSDLAGSPTFTYQDRSGVIWAGAIGHGLYRYDPVAKGLAHFQPDASDATSISHNTTWVAGEDADGGLWFGTQDGLNRFDRDSGEFRVLRNSEGGGPLLPSDEIRDLSFDEDGTLWVATAGGLALIDPQRLTTLRTITAADGLPSNVVTRVRRDIAGVLWLATAGGLARYEPDAGTVRPFTVDDGLLDSVVDDLEIAEDGRLWIRTEAGLQSLDPSEIGAPAAPGLVLTRLLVDGRTPMLAGGPIVAPSDLERLALRHDDRVLRFRFSALDFVNPERVLYQYRLSGVDEDWSTLGPGERSLIYTTLPAGDYRLEVRARSRDGVWTAAPYALAIAKAPPPWLSWPAYVAYAVAILLCFAAVLAWRTREARAHAVELGQEVRRRTAEIAAQKRTIEDQAGRLEAELESKNRLFADISHEFRTPLTLIRGPLAEAAPQAGSQRGRDRLAVAQRAAARLERLVDQLLDLARLDAGQDVSRDPQPLGAHLESQVQAFRQLAEEKGIELVTGTIESVWVRCGADPLEKIVSNLLSNAVKFSRRGDRVTVELTADGDAGRLVIADTGPGMDAVVLARVFDRFDRGGARDERVPGAGIGLALVKQLTEACGGSVELESAPGDGTRATVRLPLAEPAPSAVASVTSGDAVRLELDTAATYPRPVIDMSNGDGGTNVLVVEDNADLADYLRELLADWYRVDVASDGEKALARARETVPDLVVCDAMLPGIDGFEVCQRLKADTATSHVPVLMLTARADRDSRREAYRRHADDFLTKPFENDELLQRVDNLLEVRNLLRDRYGRTLVMEPDALDELSSPDRRFLERLTAAVERRYGDPDFDTRAMAEAVSMSERQLQRKLKGLTNNTPMEYLRGYRLERARARLEAGEPVGRVAMDVGFSTSSYFAKCYRARFGVAPGDVFPGATAAAD